MKSINIQFHDSRTSGADMLQVVIQFEESELNRIYLAKIGYRINGPGNTAKGPWQDLGEEFITAEKTTMTIEKSPSISPDSPFQQRVQFKVILFEALGSTESEEFGVYH